MTERGYQIVHGTGGSLGRATGHARYVEMESSERGSYPLPADIQQLEEMDSKDIAIMPTLHPTMCDYLEDVGALIVYGEDRITGRGAVVAREFNVPAVIDCPGATSVIRSGDTVTVDGETEVIVRHPRNQR